MQIGYPPGPHDADSERPSAQREASSRALVPVAMQPGTAVRAKRGRSIVESVSGAASARKIGATPRSRKHSG